MHDPPLSKKRSNLQIKTYASPHFQLYLSLADLSITKTKNKSALLFHDCLIPYVLNLFVYFFGVYNCCCSCDSIDR